MSDTATTGEVRWTDRQGVPRVAVLGQDGRWSGRQAGSRLPGSQTYLDLYLAYLNVFHSPLLSQAGGDRTPPGGLPGLGELHEAAAFLHGQALGHRDMLPAARAGVADTRGK